MNVSILILTRNEEQDLPRCLESVGWSDDIHVFDSFSSDRTVDRAQAAGARVTQRKFDNYSAQRNAALHTLPFRHGWVLSLDADETVPPALAEEIRGFVLRVQPTVVAARIRRRDFFQGRWLKHAQISPYYIRLVRPGQVRYEREINEVLVADGMVSDLREPFDHHPFSKGIAHWIDRHNRYSTMEAMRAIQERDSGEKFYWRRAFFDRDFNVRRRHQKGIFYRLPGRLWIKLGYMLIWRRAILDGRPGVTYAMLQAIYEYFIMLKETELSREGRGRPGS